MSEERHMNLYVITAAGYYTVGTAVVAARSVGQAVAQANKASKYHTPGRDFGGTMTYYATNAKPVGVADVANSQVVSIHEWGMPELPAKGTGKTVTF